MEATLESVDGDRVVCSCEIAIKIGGLKIEFTDTHYQE